jgi:hypothetical protein
VSFATSAASSRVLREREGVKRERGGKERERGGKERGRKRGREE